MDERRGVGDRDVDGKGARIARGRAARARVRVLRVDGEFLWGESARASGLRRSARAGRDGFWAARRGGGGVNWTSVDAEKDVRTVRVGFGLLRVYATETPSAPTRDTREILITDMMVKYFGACVLAASNRGRSMRAALVGTFAGYVDGRQGRRTRR